MMAELNPVPLGPMGDAEREARGDGAPASDAVPTTGKSGSRPFVPVHVWKSYGYNEP